VENEIQLLNYPFSFDVKEASDHLQLELTNFQSDIGLKEKFNSVSVPNIISRPLERQCYQSFCPHTKVNIFFNEGLQSTFGCSSAHCNMCVVSTDNHMT
jgi:hypothetical protein